MKARSILIAGSFAQCALAALAVTAAAVGVVVAAGCLVEGVVACIQSEFEE